VRLAVHPRSAGWLCAAVVRVLPARRVAMGRGALVVGPRRPALLGRARQHPVPVVGTRCWPVVRVRASLCDVGRPVLVERQPLGPDDASLPSAACRRPVAQPLSAARLAQAPTPGLALAPQPGQGASAGETRREALCLAWVTVVSGVLLRRSPATRAGR